MTLTNMVPAHNRALWADLAEAGIVLEEGERTMRIRRNGTIKAVDMQTAPYPGFPPPICRPSSWH